MSDANAVLSDDVGSRGGVDLSLVSSWAADGQDDDKQPQQQQHKLQFLSSSSSSPPSSSVDGRESGQIGRCLCSEEDDPQPQPVPRPQQQPQKQKPGPIKKSVSIQQQPQPLHIVPNVVQVSGPPSSGRQVRIASGLQEQQQRNSIQTTTGPSKPILSRKNWNNTIDSSGRAVPLSHHNQQQQQHSASCLKRYGSQQSCRSATTLRSYVSTSRGKSQHSYSGGRSEQPSQSEGDLADDALSGHEEKIPGGPGLNERELWSLHRAVPGLRRHDPRTSTIRQHYYPEGGWGWLVVGAAFLVQVLTTGLQLAFGVMAVQISRHFRRTPVTTTTAGGGNEPAVNMEAVWIGVMQLSGSWLWAPLVVALCRRKSTRLTAVLGGLVLALAALFASFAQQIHQVFLSYGALMSIAVTLVRESSALMVGQYFKRRRDFVEIVVQMGGGIGVILFAVFFKEALGQLGWRLGLQAATGLLLTAFFLGTFYRSASLYHPQRRAILHLKTQRKKVKVKGKPSNDRPPYFDFSVLRLKSLRMILLSSGIGAIGAYTPLFYLALQGEEDGLEASDLLLIHTFVGLAMSAGTVIIGLVVLRPGPQCLISLQYLCQATLYGIGVSMLALATVTSYHGYALFAWMYGFCLGGYQYAIHQYTLDRVRARQFARGWSLVLAVRALPSLFGIPITGYINQSTPRAGYYFSFTFTVIGATLLFFTKLYRHSAPPNLFLGAGRRSAEGEHRKRPSSSSDQPSRGECSGAELPSGGDGKPPAMVSAGAAGGGDDACENVVPARIHAESVSRDAASQEPLIYRDQQQQQQQSSGSNGGLVRMASSSAIRTVHQDVCTCPKPHQLIRNQQHMKRREFGINGQRRKSFGQRIAAKFGLDSIPWKFANNPLTELFTSSHSTVDVAAPDSPPLPPLPASILHQQRYRQQQQQQQQPAVTPNTVSMPDYPYDVEWDAEYWNGCLMGSCNHLDGECDLCHDCAECGLPFDYEEEDEEEVDEDDDVLFENEAAEIHHHHHHHHPARGGQVANMMLPDTVDIPELPPEVKRQRSRMLTLREMSISDPEHLQKIGQNCSGGVRSATAGRSSRFYDIGGAGGRLPSKLLLLRRQNTWHDVSILAPPAPPVTPKQQRVGVDVIEQITTSV